MTKPVDEEKAILSLTTVNIRKIPTADSIATKNFQTVAAPKPNSAPMQPTASATTDPNSGNAKGK